MSVTNHRARDIYLQRARRLQPIGAVADDDCESLPPVMGHKGDDGLGDFRR